MASSQARISTKIRLFNQRAEANGKTMCELCHVEPATDLHEIINRVHFPPFMIDEVPDELLACLCNHCNVNKADATESRRQLLAANVLRYGKEQAFAHIREFSAKVRTFDPDIKLFRLLML